MTSTTPILKLIEACKKGNRLAQIQLYDRYCDAMFNVALRYLNATEDAKDAMQDAFIKAFTKLHLYSPKATFGSWLKRIVINQCLDQLKKQNLHTVPLIDDVVTKPNNDWYFSTNITIPKITAAIATLPPKYKLVLNLYIIEGYDHQEISDILHIPVQTSRTQLHRAKLQLQNLLRHDT